MSRAAPIDMGKSILLTGADGFTGQHFTQQATHRGYDVYALKSDLTKVEDIASELSSKHFDYAVHLAAISAVTHADELAFYQVNLFGTLNLLQALSAQTPTPDKIILASSANIYGNARVSPITESTAPAPVNQYAMSKLAMEYMASQYGDRLPLVIVRPFNYTGVGHDDRFVVPKLVEHFRQGKKVVELGNTEVEREFNDVRTVCTAYLELLIHGAEQDSYNICSGTTYSLTQVVDMLTTLSGHEITVKVNPEYVRPNEVQRLCGDPHKLVDRIGKLEHPPLEDTLQWMLDAPSQ